MRVLHLLASPYFSGPAEAVAQLALAQRALGLEAVVAVDRKRAEAAAEELAVPRLDQLGLLSDAPLELSVKSSPLAMARDARALRQVKADIVHCHFSHDHLLARVGRHPSAKLFRSIHAQRSLRSFLPRADGFTVPTERLLAQLGDRRAMVLPAVVSPRFGPPEHRAALRADRGLPSGPVVGMVSTFQLSRRHALGVAAFARLRARQPEAHLVLVGDGELLPTIRAQVEALGLAAHVTFAGYQPGDAFVPWLQSLDELWILGLGNDFAARAAVQARACGVRVVAVDEGALAHYADAVVPADEGALEQAALSSARRDVAVETPETIARRLLSFYQGAAT